MRIALMTWAKFPAGKSWPKCDMKWVLVHCAIVVLPPSPSIVYIVGGHGDQDNI